MVDKWKYLVALLLACRMNGPDRDGNKAEGLTGIYDMVYGTIKSFHSRILTYLLICCR